MKLRNAKTVEPQETSKFGKNDEPSKVGSFVKRKKATAKTIEKAVTVSVKSSKSKKSKLLSNDNDDSIVDNKSNVDTKVILKAIDVLQQLAKIQSKKRNDLFDDNKTIILQIECVKIPDCVSRKLRFKLPHWLVTDTSEICLFVSDLKKGRRVDHEPTIQHYEDMLREKGVTMIKSIIPMRQVRVEYDQMEMKRRLLTQYDFFLADGRISGLLAHKLGTTFYKKKQLPTPINMESKDLKETIKSALHKTVMNLHGTGHAYALNIANGNHSAQEVCENVHSVLLQLVDQFPGGWNNIRSLHLKHQLSMAIPIYVSLKNKNTVENVVVPPLRPVNDTVEGELSTILGAKVKVHPRGEVEIEVDKSEISDGECSDEDLEIPEKKLKIESKNVKNPSSKKAQSKNNSEDDNDSDDEDECSEKDSEIPTKRIKLQLSKNGKDSSNKKKLEDSAENSEDNEDDSDEDENDSGEENESDEENNSDDENDSEDEDADDLPDSD